MLKPPASLLIWSSLSKIGASEELPFESIVVIVPKDLHNGFIPVSLSILLDFLIIVNICPSFGKFSLKWTVKLESILQRRSFFLEID